MTPAEIEWHILPTVGGAWDYADVFDKDGQKVLLFRSGVHRGKYYGHLSFEPHDRPVYIIYHEKGAVVEHRTQCPFTFACHIAELLPCRP